jgi:polyphosphate glucokinase
MELLGIDIGGSGIKGAIVNIHKGELATERHRIDTPQPATPEAVTDTVAEIVRHFEWRGAIGCTFPAIMKEGVAYSAANVDDAFIGTNVKRMVEEKSGCPTIILNDADAAGIAEMHFGAGRGYLGTVIMLTIGTGIGSAIFRKGVLVPNTELGHLFMENGEEGEEYASDRVRKDDDLGWKSWGKRLNAYIQHVEFLFSPDLLVIGGGVSKKHQKFFKRIETKCDLVPAELRNEAGIIGAALAAQDVM